MRADEWTTSTFCADKACVEVAPTLAEGGAVLVRSTKVPDKVVRFTRAEWSAFVLGVKAGEFDLP